MTPDLAFSIANLFALLSWVALFAWYRKSFIYKIIFSGVLVMFALLYLIYIVPGMLGSPEGGFGSILEVRALFNSDEALVAGWIHYLAFDLFVGMWIAYDASLLKINRWVILPSLIATFMAGPVGLLLHFITRICYKKTVVQVPYPYEFPKRDF